MRRFKLTKLQVKMLVEGKALSMLNGKKFVAEPKLQEELQKILDENLLEHNNLYLETPNIALVLESK